MSGVVDVAIGFKRPAVIRDFLAGQRFTRDGDEALERRLANTCEEVCAAIRDLVPASRLEGLLLGGGYGRGEGGVLRQLEGDLPYNDLEFYVFVRGHTFLTEPAFRPRLQELSTRLHPTAAVEVEFKIASLKKLRSSPPSMFSYDLLWGHRWIIGSEELLRGCEHHRDASRIPLAESSRLMMNRCSGLLFSAERLARRAFGPAEADFVGRNLAKAQLGFGDIWLGAHGQYHWSCLERHERLHRFRQFGEPPWMNALRHRHSLGVEFKLHPVRSTESREALLRQHAELTSLAQALWMWLESRRLGARFESPEQYASSPMNKCPETHALKNWLVNMRTFGPAASLRPSGSRYPRERLLNSLCLLLFEPNALEQRHTLRAVQESLQSTSSKFPELVQTYWQLWSRFN
jgi:hypothetical protein